MTIASPFFSYFDKSKYTLGQLQIIFLRQHLRVLLDCCLGVDATLIQGAPDNDEKLQTTTSTAQDAGGEGETTRPMRHSARLRANTEYMGHI
jgi:hypothetical protein